ncbi:contact-dependent growth inhibition system immunity protein [Vulgatibacter sp.]|uniref:contact-dependent growth inhibition system immunity protein n=1 Tax=Vulgatibacter sp. TaxID=1971226 RepID=UPI00356B40D3
MGGKALRHLVQFFHDYFPVGWERRWARASEAVEAFVRDERPGLVRLALDDLERLLDTGPDEHGLRKELHALDCHYQPWYEGSSASAWLDELRERFSHALYGASAERTRHA